MPITLRTLAIGGTLALGTATIATADTTKPVEPTNASFIEDVGGSERINYSGKLRMLSQRIPATACYTHAGIETDASAKMLKAATAEFDQILTGLEIGDDSLGMIGAEEDRKVLAGIKKLHELWDPLHGEITHIIENDGTSEKVAHIAASSHDILKIAKRLVSVIVAEHSDPTALLQADALTIDIAGRQRMLAQRMSKAVCLMTSGFEVEVSKKTLERARGLFDASANALRFGMPEAGINGTRNPEILAKLDSVLALWADVQPILDSVKAGEDIGATQKAFVFNSMNSLTGQMNTIVGLYNDDSKLNL